MAPLRWAAILLWIHASTPAAAQDVSKWRPYIAEASARFGIPIPWIERVMTAESGGRTALAGRPIVSPAGAMGLMQLMPRTWGEMRARLRLGANPHDPRDNILAGACYLRLMYERFGYPGLFGAYNAGPRRYADHVALGRPLPAETRTYIEIVGGETNPPRLEPPKRSDGGIFFRLRETEARLPGAASSRGAPAVSNRPGLWFVSPD